MVHTIEEQDKIGMTIATILQLRRDREHKTRWQTTWGSKTNIGIYNTIMGISEQIARGESLYE